MLYIAEALAALGPFKHLAVTRQKKSEESVHCRNIDGFQSPFHRPPSDSIKGDIADTFK